MKNLPLSSVLLKAMDNAHEGITISDFRLPDNPLIYVNKGFQKMTGFTAKECLDRNCRYLQGPETDQKAVSLIRNAISSKESIQLELVNYHRSGRAFWNYLSLTPIFDNQGVLTHYIGIQEDITAKKLLFKKENELKEQKIITATTIEAQENERHEIGKELHDNVNQLIAALRLYLKLIKDTPGDREALIDFASSLTDKILHEVRQVSHKLVGPAFHDQSLQTAITGLVSILQVVVPFPISFSYNSQLEDILNPQQKLIIYRIIQEQLNNTIKYANPKNVSVSLSICNHSVELSISDDGVGFDPSEQSMGIGFRNIRNRVILENGSFELQSQPGRGCTIIVSLPIGMQIQLPNSEAILV